MVKSLGLRIGNVALFLIGWIPAAESITFVASLNLQNLLQ